jgi:hypothetical protein
MSRKKQITQIEEATSQTILPQSKSPYVFISHDSRDADIAEEFGNLLSTVSLGILKCFRSSDKKGTQGIEYGTEWYPEIMKKLDEASDIVCLLTDNSLNRPWILYEAGVAKGKLNNTPVLGIAIGIPLEKANTGPFAQFQNCSDDEDSLTRLVIQLVKRIPNTEPKESIVKSQIKEFIKKKDSVMTKKPSKIGEDKKETAIVKLFEEVKIMFHDLQKITINKYEPDFRSKSFRYNPQFVGHIIHITRHETGDSLLGFIIIISIFKNDFPWIYEIGLEVYKLIKSNGTIKEIRLAINNFERIMEFTFHHPIFRENIRYNKDLIMIFEEIQDFLRYYLEINMRNYSQKRESEKNKNIEK